MGNAEKLSELKQMIAANPPRPYDLDDPKELRRLLVEARGYLHTCRREHHGTDREGRDHAYHALNEIVSREAVISLEWPK